MASGKINLFFEDILQMLTQIISEIRKSSPELFQKHFGLIAGLIILLKDAAAIR